MSVLLKLLSYNGASYLTWEKLSCKSLSRNHWYSSKTTLKFKLIYFQTFLCASLNCSSSFFYIRSVHNPFFEFPLPKHKHAAASGFFPTLAFFPCAVHLSKLHIRIQLIFPEHYPIFQLSMSECNERSELDPLYNSFGSKAELSLFSLSTGEKCLFMYSSTRIKMKIPAPLKPTK